MPRRFDGYPMAPGWQFDAILPELTRRSVRQIHELAAQDRPFFLYFSMTSPHEPVVPASTFRGKSGIAPIADFVMETDWSAGQVIQALTDAGIADNTIVIFTGDNGHGGSTGWDQLVNAGHRPSGPYRGRKGDIWEGGHRVPLVVRWPGHVAAGTRSDQLVCLTDLFATCAELVGAGLPDNGAEDTISFLTSALGRQPVERRTSVVVHSVDGEFAFRDGPWKLVFRMSGRTCDESRGKPTIAELYNLESDVAEARDVAAQHPGIVKRMREQLDRLVARGATRPGLYAANDTVVRYDITQMARCGQSAR